MHERDVESLQVVVAVERPVGAHQVVARVRGVEDELVEGQPGEALAHRREQLVERVQQGVRSRFYDRGRYSPGREQGVHHFHRLLARFLNG